MGRWVFTCRPFDDFYQLRPELPNQNHQVNTIGYTLLAGFFASVLVHTIVAPAGSLIARLFCFPALRFLGKYSYGLYVMHGLLHETIDWAFPTEMLCNVLHSFVLGAIARFVLGTGISLLAAIASWHLYEKHFLKLKRFFEYRVTTLAEPVEAARTSIG